jgi:hypothetical protein
VGETNPLKRLIEWRVSAALEPTPPNETLLEVQQPVYDCSTSTGSGSR